MTPRWHRILQKLQASTRIVPGPLPTPCWEWTGPDDGEQGYGRMSLDGHTVKVHRVGYMQFNGYLPPKKHVDHLCRNRRCWNPDHLEAVTHKQNQRRRRKAVVGKCMTGGIALHPDHLNTQYFSGIDMGVEPGFTVLASYDPVASSQMKEYRCLHCPDKDKPGMCVAGMKCEAALRSSGFQPGLTFFSKDQLQAALATLDQVQQCACEKLGAKQGRRCPGCPKALPGTAPTAPTQPEPVPAEPTLGSEEALGGVSQRNSPPSLEGSDDSAADTVRYGKVGRKADS